MFLTVELKLKWKKRLNSEEGEEGKRNEGSKEP